MKVVLKRCGSFSNISEEDYDGKTYSEAPGPFKLRGERFTKQLESSEVGYSIIIRWSNPLHSKPFRHAFSPPIIFQTKQERVSIEKAARVYPRRPSIRLLKAPRQSALLYPSSLMFSINRKPEKGFRTRAYEHLIYFRSDKTEMIDSSHHRRKI